jgi:ribosomal protein S12 methylthiotransferase
MRKIYFLSLGCDKNRVDGEVMIGMLRLAGHTISPQAENADTIVVNTCGFIADAVRESIDTILELAEHKKNGACRTLIITGCMAVRYREEILAEIPEVDSLLGIGEGDKLLGLLADGGEHAPVTAISARVAARTDDATPHIAYVKVSDGCDNNCTYCTIPAIRGGYAERAAADILAECAALASVGAREIVLIAQDVARFSDLPSLLRGIAAIEAVRWIRIMYAYPERISDGLIAEMARNTKVVKYLDMPIQHCSTAVLRRMGRDGGRAQLAALVARLRAAMPDIALRTTVMVGFPGETRAQFVSLCKFLTAQKFSRVGAFPYSRESSTPAADMPMQVRESTKMRRLDEIMTLQRDIHFAAQQALVGSTLPVMMDTPNIGRTPYDAYESDCVVHVAGTPLSPGEIYQVKITATSGYDLEGVLA